jgi:hypothetical protein
MTPPTDTDSRPGGLRADPDTLAWLQHAAPNRAARTHKQQRDAERVRIRLDVPPLIKDVLERVAADLGTSSSQAGAYLLATALIAYLQDQPEVPCVPSRSPRVAASVDLGPVLEALANSAEASKWVE